MGEAFLGVPPVSVGNRGIRVHAVHRLSLPFTPGRREQPAGPVSQHFCEAILPVEGNPQSGVYIQEKGESPFRTTGSTDY